MTRYFIRKILFRELKKFLKNFSIWKKIWKKLENWYFGKLLELDKSYSLTSCHKFNLMKTNITTVSNINYCQYIMKESKY